MVEKDAMIMIQLMMMIHGMMMNVVKINGHVMMVNVFQQVGYVILRLTVKMDLTNICTLVVCKIHMVYTKKMTYVLKSLENVLKINGNVMVVNVFQQNIYVMVHLIMEMLNIQLTVMMDLTM